MNKYKLRKNFISLLFKPEKMVKGKLAFKTHNDYWLGTNEPVIILVSIHSIFHEPDSGELKMNALVSLIREHVKGKVTILFSDQAHLKTRSLRYQNNLEKALNECRLTAQTLDHRYRSYFGNCDVAYWHSYISKDESFGFALDFLSRVYESDINFQRLIRQDAETTYINERKLEFSNKVIFIEKAIEDLLEQCASLFVLAKNGYRFQFYPGKSYSSVEYVNQVFIPQEKQVSWVDVFLSIEKKTVVK